MAKNNSKGVTRHKKKGKDKMGQYYRIAIKNDGMVYINHRTIGNQRESGKLMEHSYIHNYLMDSVANYLYNNPSQLIWVGDYTEADEILTATNGDVDYKVIWGIWRDNNSKDGVDIKNYLNLELCKRFDYKGTYLINYDKKVYFSFDKYLESFDEKTDIINPISLLTAIGNGRGCGDYMGTNEQIVGDWKWDVIAIKEQAPSDFTELDIKNVLFQEKRS